MNGSRKLKTTSPGLDGTRFHRDDEALRPGRSWASASSAARYSREEVEAGTLQAIPLAPEPMVRSLGLIYRKDKALSKAALGFIQVTMAHFGSQSTLSRDSLMPAALAG